MIANQTPLGIGLVGWGYASATLHAPLIRATPGLRLAAVASSRAVDLRADAAIGCPILPTLADLLARTDVDCVVIATPNDSHHRLARQALEAGKHVVLDKPMTLDVDQADDLIALARRADRLLSVFHNRRWDSDFLTLQSVLNSGALGRVTHFESHFDRYRPRVRARWRESAQAGGGLWYDLGPHLLDQALLLFGAPEALWLDTQAQRDGALCDDWFHAVLRYPGQRVVLHASALAARQSPRFVVHGSKGSFEKWGQDVQEEQLKSGWRPGDVGWGHDLRGGLITLERDDALQTRPVAAIAGDYRHFYSGLRDAARTPATPLPVTAAQAREVMAWLDAGRHAAATGLWQSGSTPDQRCVSLTHPG